MSDKFLRPPAASPGTASNAKRRWLLTRVVQGFAITGLGFLTYPFIKSWIPTFSEDKSLDVSLEDLAAGESRLVRFRGRNLYIQRRSREMVRAIEESTLALKDPASADSTQPAFAQNAFRSLRPEVLVIYSNCTHLGCEVAAVNDAGIGFKCPCHQSNYDLAGRVLADAAAPTNLEVPDYSFVAGNIVRLEAKPS
ncbi:MAG: ubiquinol-cytochrome c reductase iron-sulfur subunit [Pseudomonadales bacterium]|jgi:ubiquinol-cytochrome c reductase iron-sulfur subunit|nr:ubiquinol-cytochrome c reductase iron-sulfur subunit [Pseudomonadales bacterium]MDP4911331.1 ubiquinol-cytochrome c reductase iron-sulfur subunit [Pseudomonadales bacterium]MDP5059760.1 ubiquinol-cytochrome c reductase iron-sulfur subunit [Pseudomonadales bacterium]